MVTSLRWNVADLEALPEDDNRYEIIDGELYVTTQPSWGHQRIALNIGGLLNSWSLQTGAGMANVNPGVILTEDTAVAPDVVWVSATRLPQALAPDGKLHGVPDLAVEILSPGERNEHRDRDVKLKTYSRFGVREYWIVNPKRREISVFRREQAMLALVATLFETDTMISPLLPGFASPVASFFAGGDLSVDN